jgi:sialic acid synthase SpsE
MSTEIQIGSRIIGKGHPLFIIAEAGVTCNYDMEITKQLIDVVRSAGADAIKFIFWFPEEFMSDKAVTYSYKTVDGTSSENMYEMLSKLKFSLDQWHEIKAYADERGVILLSTVNSPSGIKYGEAIGLEAYKLSSWDFNYLPLWRQIARLRKPMLIDTGPVTTLDVAKVVALMHEEGNDQCVFLHCFHTNNYPEMNMLAIPYLETTFNCLAGYSAESTNDEMDIVAVALGAVVIEKRLTMSRSLPGHHHALSKEPKEFETYVAMMRNIQAGLGVEDLRPSHNDLAERKKWFRRIVANRDLPKGTKLTAEMLEGKRPADGISPEYLDFFVGRVTTRDLRYNEPLRWEDV